MSAWVVTNGLRLARVEALDPFEACAVARRSTQGRLDANREPLTVTDAGAWDRRQSAAQAARRAEFEERRAAWEAKRTAVAGEPLAEVRP